MGNEATFPKSHKVTLYPGEWVLEAETNLMYIKKAEKKKKNNQTDMYEPARGLCIKSTCQANLKPEFKSQISW